MREGQQSFALWGHPYNWNGASSVGWVEVEFDTPLLPKPSGPPIPIPGARPVSSNVFGDLYSSRMIYYQPAGAPLALAGGKFVATGAISFLPGIPGAADVPDGSINQTPTSNGTWNPGTRGYGVWNSNLNTVIQMDAQVHQTPPAQSVAINFSRCYPDFSPWIIGGFSAHLELQHGTQGNYEYDFDQSDLQLGPWLQANYANDPLNPFASGTSLLATVQNWRRNFRLADPVSGQPQDRPLTWHHLEDMKTMQLVPGPGLNNPGIGGGVPHNGGAQWARVARW